MTDFTRPEVETHEKNVDSRQTKTENHSKRNMKPQ